VKSEEKLMGQDKEDLKSYIKRCAHNQGKRRNSFTASHRQADVQSFPGKQDFIVSDGYLGKEIASFQTSHPSPSFFRFYC